MVDLQARHPLESTVNPEDDFTASSRVAVRNLQPQNLKAEAFTPLSRKGTSPFNESSEESERNKCDSRSFCPHVYNVSRGPQAWPAGYTGSQSAGSVQPSALGDFKRDRGTKLDCPGKLGPVSWSCGSVVNRAKGPNKRPHVDITR